MTHGRYCKYNRKAIASPCLQCIASVYVAGCAERRDPTEPGPGHGDSQLRGAVQPGQQQVSN